MDKLEYWLEQQLQGKDVPLNLPAEKQDLHGLMLIDAIQAHHAWIERLELTLRGQNPEEYDPAIVGADHLCKLGEWLHGDGAVLQQYAEFGELMATHKQFHEVAGTILKDHKTGQFASAISALRHDLVNVSKQVQVCLVKLLMASQKG